ncbi:MAG: homocitrate synthase/isopropylmalate synthase family protein [Saprospiraceae bacterium]|jgi:isopropylmalate/homocitrate/citramalate synthase
MSQEKRKILIEDTCLREGEQMARVVLTEKQKRAILDGLQRCNVPYAEVGIPVMGSAELRDLLNLIRDYKDPMLIGWNRGMVSDLEHSARAGFRGVHIGIPTSQAHLQGQLKKDENWVIDTAGKLVEFSKNEGMEIISVSAIDMSRSKIEFLQKYAQALESAGATRLRLSDTVGVFNPEKTREVVLKIREVSSIPLQMHMHNDYGLSLANMLAGVNAGAEQVQVTVNGLGERNGITALHQAVVALELMYGYDTGVNLKELLPLSELVAAFTNFPIANNEPVIGRGAFSHESGIHVDGMLKSQESFQPFDPTLVGRHHEFVLGKHSGSSSLQWFLRQEGIDVTREEAADLLPFVREFATENNGSFDPKFLAFFWKLYKNKSLEEAS